MNQNKNLSLSIQVQNGNAVSSTREFRTKEKALKKCQNCQTEKTNPWCDKCGRVLGGQPWIKPL